MLKFWSTPMGFEILEIRFVDLKEITKFWSTPMGFEILVSPFYCLFLFFVLKYPYGIWNYETNQVSKDWNNVLKYPYGIWNLTIAGVVHQLGKVLKYPYGIWNRL